MDCGYLLEPPRRGGSNEYPQSMFSSRNMKNITVFVSENFKFLEEKFSIYLNRHVFVMSIKSQPQRLSQMHVRLVIRRSPVLSHWVWQQCCVDIDHKIFSTVILSLQLIQEGQWQFLGKECTSSG